IGRCSVDDTEQVQNVVHKILNYNPYSLKWKDRMLIATGYDPDLYGHTNEALTQLDTFLPFDSIYLFSPDDYNSMYTYDNFTLKKPYNLSRFLKTWKSGISMFYYDDHGSPSGINFYYSDIDSANYNGILPMMVNMACLTGAFHNNDDCFCQFYAPEKIAPGSWSRAPIYE
ncbi:MAG: C25 family cysteine peptidase, partial [Bacteroidales bacterium]